MTQFHEGQEVEVAEIRGDPRPFRVWRKAKIVCGIISGPVFKEPQDQYEVQFPDGTRVVVNTEHIRAVQNRAERFDVLKSYEDSQQDECPHPNLAPPGAVSP